MIIPFCKLNRYRYGYATNSSSTHSIIWAEKHNLIEYNDNNFGWNEFILTNPKTKEMYLYAQLISNKYEPDTIKTFAKKNLKHITNDDINELSEYGVDHQSILCIPTEFNTNTPHEKYFNCIRKILLNENVIIIGGNDNSEPTITMPNNHIVLKLPENYDKYTAREERDHVYLLFNKHNGDKFEVDFTEHLNIIKKGTPHEK